jgi:preprotein translocase subunit SecF
MKKHLKKQYTRILKLLLIAAIIILLILIFGFVKEYIQDLMDKLDFLVKYTQSQSTHIQALETELHNLEVTNAKLENVLTYQHEQIQELKVNGNTMTFTMQPREVTMEDLHKEIEPQLHNDQFEFVSPSTIAATVLGALMLVKGTVGTLFPALP